MSFSMHSHTVAAAGFPQPAPAPVPQAGAELALSPAQLGAPGTPASVWPAFLTGHATSPVRVLLVDDDPHIRLVIAQELMADARTLLVGQAASVREGRRAIKQHDFDVLLVDDDPHIRLVIAQELMADARTLLVGQAASVREGRRAIKQHDFDVLLVDLNLGDGSAFDLLEYLKPVRPSAQAVVISVMENDEEVLRAFELGACGYVGKSCWFGNYAQAVLQVANGGASITPHLARRLLQRFDRTNSAENKRRQPDEADRLSAREKEILRLVASGFTSGEIAKRLLISAQTVNTHIKNVYRKLQVRTRAQAVTLASQYGLLF